MSGQIESLLEQGIEAARTKEKKRARDLLVRVIELDQRNEKAWLWLSSVAETLADKEVCLENVLIINPDNTYAAMGLQHLRRQPQDESAPPSMLPSLTGPRTLAEREWGASTAEISPPPAERVCPNCSFRNPGWSYVCDRCGASLRHLNLRETLGEASKPRGRSFITLFGAWVGAFVFSRLWAFLPEVELASWGRSLAALGLAALFATIWRTMTSLALWLLVGHGEWKTQIAINALRSVAQTLPPVLLLTLACVPIALLTWMVARLVGGRQSFKIHMHLTAVAFSAWVVLAALLVPLTILVPYLLGGDIRSDLSFDAAATFVTVAVSASGPIWLTQAVRTA
ncbi:MAG: hypothetical protein IMY86_01085, partial [Chloroflexi bacterium]|nr:hypothetical protein [Chloroflexota bacterium]